MLADSREIARHGRARFLVMPEAARQAMAGGIAVEMQPAILADDPIHRPHAGHLVAPAGRGAAVTGITRTPARCSRSSAS